MNIYLDVNGVLLTKQDKPAKHVIKFLKYITDRHDVYWLTTHCQGDTEHLLDYLSDRLSEEAMQYAKLIKPTTWDTWKTEGIDFSKDFRWLDDNVFTEELQELKKNDCEDKLINIDLVKNPNQLLDIVNEKCIKNFTRNIVR